MAKREDHLNIREPNVNRSGYKCGTVHCVAGWYAVGAINLRKKGLTYQDGVYKINRDLGFTNIYFISASELEIWASLNRNVWGNDNGHFMFSNAIAYYHPTKRPNGALNLQHIIDHITEVYERTLILEAKENPREDITEPQRKDISKSLAVITC